MDRLRRTHARFPCDLKVEVVTGVVGGVRLGPGTLIDISLSGALLRFSGSLKAGASYRMVCEWKEGVLELPGRLARDAGRSAKHPASRHYGLAFNLTYDQEKALLRLIDVIRREKPSDDGFLRNYWSA